MAPGIPGFAQEWQGFIAAGKKIASSDLVEISIGGNDARQYYQTGGTLAGVPAAATFSANQALAGVNALVAAGARNIVFTTGDVSQLPEATGNPAAPVGAAFSQAYNAQMQAALAGIARSGVSVELVDVALLGNLIKANPTRWTHHPVRGDIRTAHHQQPDGAEFVVATDLRPGRGRCGGAGVEQYCADGECVTNLCTPGRQ